MNLEEGTLEAMVTQDESEQPLDPYFVYLTIGGGEDFEHSIGVNSLYPDSSPQSPGISTSKLRVSGNPGVIFDAINIESDSLNCALTSTCSTPDSVNLST